MKEMTILVGLPRAGKSTWIEENKTDKDVVVSADALRYLVYNHKFWTEGEPLMWSVRGILLNMLMQQGKDLIIDETNTTVNRRKPLIDLAMKYGYYVTVVRLETTEEECLKRAYAENNPNLAEVIKRQAKQIEEPSLDEGIDIIIFR